MVESVAKWTVISSSRGAEAPYLVLIIVIWESRPRIARFSDFSQGADNLGVWVKFTDI